MGQVIILREAFAWTLDRRGLPELVLAIAPTDSAVSIHRHEAAQRALRPPVENLLLLHFGTERNVRFLYEHQYMAQRSPEVTNRWKSRLTAKGVWEYDFAGYVPKVRKGWQ